MCEFNRDIFRRATNNTLIYLARAARRNLHSTKKRIVIPKRSEGPPETCMLRYPRNDKWVSLRSGTKLLYLRARLPAGREARPFCHCEPACRPAGRHDEACLPSGRQSPTKVSRDCPPAGRAGFVSLAMTTHYSDLRPPTSDFRPPTSDFTPFNLIT